MTPRSKRTDSAPAFQRKSIAVQHYGGLSVESRTSRTLLLDVTRKRPRHFYRRSCQFSRYEFQFHVPGGLSVGPVFPAQNPVFRRSVKPHHHSPEMDVAPLTNADFRRVLVIVTQDWNLAFSAILQHGGVALAGRFGRVQSAAYGREPLS